MVPQETIESLVASLSQNTLKQYESALKNWWQFCILTNRKFKMPTRNSLLCFLTYMFKKGASYATLNTYRSAVSLLSNDKVGEDPMISRFFKGIAKIRPAKPKYSFTWDVSIVLNYLKNMKPLVDLDLQEVTEKAVTLIALCTAHRAQTLVNIKIGNIKSSITGLEIKITDLIKTSSHGRLQPLLLLPRFTNDNRLCVASVIERYIEITKSLRDTEKLFIATVKPHKAVCAQTISRWIKTVLRG